MESLQKAEFLIPLKETKEKTLIIGAGEIGKSLAEVLATKYEVVLKDKNDKIEGTFRVINICYPYSDKFIEITKEYIAKYKPELTIIHSTVKPGTTRTLGTGVVHSPINGRHPHLAKSILIFTKFVGGNDIYSIFNAVEFMRQANIKPFVLASSVASELAKVLCTTYYGWNIMYMKEVARLCDEFEVPFHEVYTEWNNEYNQGYQLFGEFRFLRPVLYPVQGEIGGHCVINNCDLLDDFLTNTLKERNTIYSGKKKKK